MPLDILYEDEWLVAVDKPAGLVVHPTYKNVSGTLLDELHARREGRLFLLGRLDRLTSGVVIAAKDLEVYTRMQRGWRDAQKDYLAVVAGCVDPLHGEIDLPLGTDPADRRRRVVRPDGAPSRTRFERLAYSEATGMSFICCRLVTGRRHQIRVHLQARGWPVIGDPVYGGRELPGVPRLALHAWRAVLPHPATGGALRITSPLPSDFCELLVAAGLPLTH